MLKWELGRQGSGYRKMKLGQGRFWDLYVLDYPPGIGIPEHSDPVAGKRHLRVNLAVRTGHSVLSAEAMLFHIGQRLSVFWSDRKHSVTANESRRVVVSLGLALSDALGSWINASRSPSG
ncbi:MAG TPA: hypothetical protein VGM39_15090 [Kofleriaceae bacterium]|jgi:hypothetical protein